MKTLENFLIEVANFICKILDVTPGQIESVKRKRRGPERDADRPDVMEA